MIERVARCRGQDTNEGGQIPTTDPAVQCADQPVPIAQDHGPIEVGRRVGLDVLEAEHIRRVIESAISLEEAADILNIDPSTLYRKRKKLGM